MSNSSNTIYLNKILGNMDAMKTDVSSKLDALSGSLSAVNSSVSSISSSITGMENNLTTEIQNSYMDWSNITCKRLNVDNGDGNDNTERRILSISGKGKIYAVVAYVAPYSTNELGLQIKTDGVSRHNMISKSANTHGMYFDKTILSYALSESGSYVLTTLGCFRTSANFEDYDKYKMSAKPSNPYNSYSGNLIFRSPISFNSSFEVIVIRTSSDDNKYVWVIYSLD